jgi:acyl-CoA thioester hydrolase
MPRHVHPHRVRYREVDPMGLVYHVHCLDWFEAARTEALRSSGISYREIEESGVSMPVVDLAVRYHRPVRYDDRIEIGVTWTGEAPVARIRFDYEVRREDEPDVLVSGHVTLCFVDRASGRPVRAPGMLRDALERLALPS